jgi:GMP synthase PP-ATPase subunit
MPTVVMTSAPAQSGGVGSAVIGTLLSATILAALIAAAVNVMLARRKSREEERARLRDRFAQAYGSYAEYCEFAYAIRRRRHDDPSAERVRISEELRKVQAELSAHEAWVKLESETVGMAYTELIQQMRKTAGGAMRQAWIDEPATTDVGVNIPPETVDLSPLKPFETAYMDTVATHLRALAPWWSK